MRHICKCGNDDRFGGWIDSKGVFTCKKCIDKDRNKEEKKP